MCQWPEGRNPVEGRSPMKGRSPMASNGTWRCSWKSFLSCSSSLFTSSSCPCMAASRACMGPRRHCTGEDKLASFEYSRDSWIVARLADARWSHGQPEACTSEHHHATSPPPSPSPAPRRRQAVHVHRCIPVWPLPRLALLSSGVHSNPRGPSAKGGG